jgi:fused signal recognition particle receptor
MKVAVRRLAKAGMILVALCVVGVPPTSSLLEAGPPGASRNPSVLDDAIESFQWHENLRRQPLPSAQRPQEQPRPVPEQPDLSGLPAPASVPVQPQAGDAVPQPLLVKPHPGEPAQPNLPLIKPKIVEPTAEEPQPRARRIPQPYVKPVPSPAAEGRLIQPELPQDPAQASVPQAQKRVRPRRPAVPAKPEQGANSQLGAPTIESPPVQPTIDGRGPADRKKGPVTLKEAFNPAVTEQPAVSPYPQPAEAGEPAPLAKPRIGPR